MNVLYLVLPAIVAAAISAALTPIARRFALRVGAIDKPDPRKVHQQPQPRLGGLAVVVSVGVILVLMAIFGAPGVESLVEQTTFILGLGLGVLPVFVVSVIDDVRPLRPGPKFAAQLAGAIVAISFGIRLPAEVHLFGEPIPLGALAIPISLLWIVGVTNAFNLVDGLDGLSAGLALISALSLAGVSALVGMNALASVSFVLAGALIGFLPYNIYPARVFLGDSGAATIGFCLACLALESSSVLTAGMAVLLPIVVMGLPVAETLISMLRRSLRRLTHRGEERGIFDADRQHIHHRLLDLGLDHRRAVLTLYGIGLILAACGFGSLFFNSQGAAVLLATMLIAAFIGVQRLGYDEFAILRRRVVLRAFDAPVLKAALFSVFVDLAVVAFAIYSAIVLKYDDWSLTAKWPLVEVLITVMPAATLLVFWAMRVYRAAWRQASLEDLLRSSWSVLVATALGWIVCALVLEERPPVTLFVIYTLILLMGVNGARASYRLMFHWTVRAATDGDAVVIYGAGRWGSLALRELRSNRGMKIRPVGFVDDDEKKIGRYLNGYPVLGSSDSLPLLFARDGIRGVVVASEKIPPSRLHGAMRAAEDAGAWVKVIRIELRTMEPEHAPRAKPVLIDAETDEILVLAESPQ